MVKATTIDRTSQKEVAELNDLLKEYYNIKFFEGTQINTADDSLSPELLKKHPLFNKSLKDRVLKIDLKKLTREPVKDKEFSGDVITLLKNINE